MEQATSKINKTNNSFNFNVDSEETEIPENNGVLTVNNSFMDMYPLLSSYVQAKTFEMKNENSVLRISPKQLIFKYNMETMEVENPTKLFKILNVSDSPTKIVIIPRQTENFKFNYLPQNWLVPGIPLIISVDFKPTERRPYNDWLRVGCPADCNLMVPIKAIPSIINNICIPERVNFGFVEIGQRATFVVTINPVKNRIIEFAFVPIKETLGFEIIPSEGKVETEPVNIEISYCPCSYITVSVPVLLYLLPLLVTPYYFTVEAHTKPVPKRVPTASGGNASKRDSVKSYETSSYTSSSKKGVQREIDPTLKCDPFAFTQHDVNLFLINKSFKLRDPNEQLGMPQSN